MDSYVSIYPYRIFQYVMEPDKVIENFQWIRVDHGQVTTVMNEGKERTLMV